MEGARGMSKSVTVMLPGVNWVPKDLPEKKPKADKGREREEAHKSYNERYVGLRLKYAKFGF